MFEMFCQKLDHIKMLPCHESSQDHDQQALIDEKISSFTQKFVQFNWDGWTRYILSPSPYLHIKGNSASKQGLFNIAVYG